MNTLEVTLMTGERAQMFEVEHAERILRMNPNGGWKLPANSSFEFTTRAGLTRKKVITAKTEKSKNADINGDNGEA